MDKNERESVIVLFFIVGEIVCREPLFDISWVPPAAACWFVFSN